MSQTLCLFRMNNVFRFQLCRNKLHGQKGPKKGRCLTREFKNPSQNWQLENSKTSCIVPLFREFKDSDSGQLGRRLNNGVMGCSSADPLASPKEQDNATRSCEHQSRQG